MRCHPVIDWHYAEIWTVSRDHLHGWRGCGRNEWRGRDVTDVAGVGAQFIRHLGIPYCELYDQGYTSLGGTTDTHPNPALRAEGQEARFRPAYELEMDEEERLGRDR